MEHQPELEVLALRQAGGFACPVGYGLLEVSGPDAARFLQSRTTNDVEAIAGGSRAAPTEVAPTAARTGGGQASSLLDRRAHLEAYFSLHRLDDSFFIVAEREQLSRIAEQLEKFLFNEKAEITDRSPDGHCVAIQGCLARKLLAKALNLEQLPVSREHDVARVDVWGIECLLIRRTITGEEGYLLWTDKGSEELLVERLKAAAGENGLVQMSDRALEIARVEAGIPKYGVDMSNENLLPETGLEESAVSYTKGCYLGQEVIARIKTFGAPRRGLCGLLFPDGVRYELAPDSNVVLDGQDVGVVKSCVYSPSLKRTIAMAYLNREQRVPNQNLQIEVNGNTVSATVCLLPFLQAVTPEARSWEIYESALSEFATGDETKAIASLREALILDPLSADCYETLGVILSKHDELAEAISLMKKLARLDPESIMAHANLSVFYMQQGDKEAAEEEKAIAMSIRMQSLAREVDQQKKVEQSQQQIREQALERMKMFEQVLEIDSDDLLANHGLGSIHVELKEYERAIPYLQKAIALKPTHTVAYVALGAAYQGTNKIDQAVDIYKKGIEVAAKRGDMTPLKDMQARLSEIEKGSTG